MQPAFLESIVGVQSSDCPPSGVSYKLAPPGRDRFLGLLTNEKRGRWSLYLSPLSAAVTLV
jgi:hypothetical protein